MQESVELSRSDFGEGANRSVVLARTFGCRNDSFTRQNFLFHFSSDSWKVVGFSLVVPGIIRSYLAKRCPSCFSMQVFSTNQSNDTATDCASQSLKDAGLRRRTSTTLVHTAFSFRHTHRRSSSWRQ